MEETFKSYWIPISRSLHQDHPAFWLGCENTCRKIYNSPVKIAAHPGEEEREREMERESKKEKGR